jgi:hypothetical protein
MWTTAERLASYLKIQGVTVGSPTHTALDRIARAASDFVEGYLCRPVGCFNKTSYFDVPRRDDVSIMIPASVSSIIAVSLVGTPDQTLDLGELQWDSVGASTELWRVRGAWPYAQGRKPIKITYRTGHVATWTGLAAASITPPNLHLEPVAVRIDGVAATITALAPAAGQYRVINGVYAFAAADVGKTAEITYAQVPPAIEQAIIDLTAFAFQGASRIGEVSKSLGGSETVSFSQSALTPSAVMMLSAYRGTFA